MALDSEMNTSFAQSFQFLPENHKSGGKLVSQYSNGATQVMAVLYNVMPLSFVVVDVVWGRGGGVVPRQNLFCRDVFNVFNVFCILGVFKHPKGFIKNIYFVRLAKKGHKVRTETESSFVDFRAEKVIVVAVGPLWGMGLVWCGRFNHFVKKTCSFSTGKYFQA